MEKSPRNFTRALAKYEGCNIILEMWDGTDWENQTEVGSILYDINEIIEKKQRYLDMLRNASKRIEHNVDRAYLEECLAEFGIKVGSKHSIIVEG